MDTPAPAAPTAPAAGAPTPAAGAPPADPGQPGAGFMDYAAIPEPNAGAYPPLDAPLGEQPEGEVAPAGEPEVPEGGEPADPETPETPAALLAGRFKTQEELIKGFLETDKRYTESGREAIRLFEENKTLRGEHSKTLELIEDLKAQVEEAKNTPQFKELTKDQVEALPLSEQVEYVTELKLRKQRLESEKVEKARQKQAEADKRVKTQAAIRDEIRVMEADAKNYPGFVELGPVMNELLDITGGVIGGHEWTPKLMYYAALGLKEVHAREAGKKARADAEAKAKAAAAAAALAAGRTGRTLTRTVPPGGNGIQSDKDFENETLGAGRRPVFPR